MKKEYGRWMVISFFVSVITMAFSIFCLFSGELGGASVGLFLSVVCFMLCRAARELYEEAFDDEDE